MNDGRAFVILGGSSTANLNFSITKQGVFLLMISAARGDNEMINLMIQNETLDLN